MNVGRAHPPALALTAALAAAALAAAAAAIAALATGPRVDPGTPSARPGAPAAQPDATPAARPGAPAVSGREAPRRGGTLVIALRADVDAFNPYTAAEASSFNVLELLYPRLVHERLEPSGPAFVPWAARRFEVAPDGRSVRYVLRDEARWSDGSPLTCADARFTLTAQRAPELAWPGVTLKEPVTAVDCEGERTVVFRLARPLANPVLDTNDDALVPRAYAAVPFAEWAGRRWDVGAVTAGPFRLAKAVAGQEVVLERDPAFWDAPRPYVDRVVFRVYPDAAAALRGLLDGEVDVLDRIPATRAGEVRARGRTLLDVPSLAYTFIAWNVLAPGAYAPRPGETAPDIRRLRRERPHPVLADARVRRALTLATDRADLVRGLWGGHARVGVSPVVSALWAHDPAAALPYDPAAARRLLAEAGWADADGDGVREKGGRRLELEVLTDADNALRRDALDRVAANLATVGVRLVPRPLPRAELVARARAKNFDGALFGWRAGSRIEPQAILHTEAAANRGNNLGAWGTDASDALLAEAAAAPTAEAARPLWRAWQALFREEQPYTILYEERTLVGLGARVRGATPSALNPYDGLEHWWIAP